MEASAPTVEERFQYMPRVIGKNSDTKLNADDCPTNSKISADQLAITAESTATNTTDIRMMVSSLWSLTFLKYGRTRFSPMIVAGASIAPEVVLKMADNKAPKNNTCKAIGAWRNTIMGTII